MLSGKLPCSNCWATSVSPVCPRWSAIGPDQKGAWCAWLYCAALTLQTFFAISVGFVTDCQGPHQDLGSCGTPDVALKAASSGMPILRRPFPPNLLRRCPSFLYIFCLFSLLMSCLSCSSTLSSCTKTMDGWSKCGEGWKTMASARLSKHPSCNCWCWACSFLKDWEAARLHDSISVGVSSGLSSMLPSDLYRSSWCEETGKFLLCLKCKSQ